VGSTTFSFYPTFSSKSNVSPSKEVDIKYEERDDEIFVQADCMTAGSTTLMLQSSLCPLIYFNSNRKNVKAVMKGGTNVDFSPPIDEVTDLLIPLINKHFLKSENVVQVICKNRGFYPKGRGEIEVIVDKKISSRQVLHPITLIERGDKITKATFRLYYAHNDHSSFIDKMTEVIKTELLKRDFMQPFKQSIQIDIQKIRINNNPCRSKVVFGSGFLTDSSDNMFGSSFHSKDFSGKKKQDLRIDDHITFAKNMIKHLEKQIQEMGCVDEYVQDQLIIFMSLAKGRSQIRTGPLTLHTQTAIHFCTMMTGAVFKVTEQSDKSFIIECEGIGFPIQ